MGLKGRTNMRQARLVLVAALIAALALSGACVPPMIAGSEEPLYIMIMTHVEGDKPEPNGSPTCVNDLHYQMDPLPLLGQLPRGNSFAVDIAGKELIHEISQRYTDSEGKKPKLFIEPAGEFWQTEADPRYGNKLFQKYDYLALGYEFGIQGRCQGNTPRCEKPEEAIARLDRTLAARKEDPEPKRIYYFAFTVHSNGVWMDFHLAQAGQPMRCEGAGLVALRDAIQQRINAGAKIKFVAPKELRGVFEGR